MNEDTKEYTLDDLEDIIREYSSQPQVPDTGGDTARLDDVHKVAAPPAQPTKPLPDLDADVRIYEKPKKKSAVNDRTVQWDGQYSTGRIPMPEPIAFPQPKASADVFEQRYQDLLKKGFSDLRAGLFLNLIAFVAAACMALLHHRVQGSRLQLMIVGQILLLLLSGAVGYVRLREGVQQLRQRRFGFDAMLVVTLALCLIDSLICLGNGNLPFSAVFSLQMLMAQWAQYQKKQVRLSRLDTLRKAIDLTAVVKHGGYFRSQPAYQSAPGEFADFSDDQDPSDDEKLLYRFAFGAVALGAILALVTTVLRGIAMGVRVYAAALLAAMPASAFICYVRPAAIMEKRLHKLGAVLCGWKGLQQVEKRGYFPLAHGDLFPENHVKLNGVRFYGERNPNTIVSYVSALMAADGGALGLPFEQLRASRNARTCRVEDLTSYPDGVGGRVDGLTVLAGTIDFIENMGVDLKEVSRIPNAVYAAINQSLCAVFAVSFTCSKSSAAGLRTLCDGAAIKPVLVDCDFVLTDTFLEQRLGVDVHRMQFPDCMTRMNLADKAPPKDAPVIALVTRRGLAPRAYAVTGSAAIRSAWRTGTKVHMLGGGIGFAVVSVLAVCGAFSLLAPHNLLLYACLWMIPGVLITEWTRTV